MGLIERGEDFLASMGWNMDTQKGLVTGGVEDRLRDRRVREKWEEIKRVGYELATVVNCLPFELELHASWGHFRIRGADVKNNELFFFHTIKIPRMDMCDMGDGKFSPSPIMPVQIAMEFERLYVEYGGVFFYRGSSEEPPKDFLTQVEQAQVRMQQWMIHQYELGNDYWQRYNKQTRYISPRMREAAQFLMRRRLIDQLPEWVSITRDIAGTKLCPACAETVKSAAKVCRFCSFAIDAEFVEGNAGKFGATPGSSEPTAPAPVVAAAIGSDDGDEEGDDVSDKDILDDKVQVEVKEVVVKSPKREKK